MPATTSSNLLLAALPQEIQPRIRSLLVTVELRPRQLLIREAGDNDGVYFPERGVLSLTKTMEDGRVAEVGVVGREGLVGYLAAFGEEQSRHDVMVQIPDVTAKFLPRREFLEEMSHEGPFKEIVNRYVLAANAMTSMSVACNALHTAEERCARWLLHAHDRVGTRQFDLSHEFLAMMLGVRRPTATIAAGILQNAGLIEYHRGRMSIVDRAKLEEASCECYASVQAEFEGLLPPAG